jgi:Fe-S cluster assembly iron-binding protein IscA
MLQVTDDAKEVLIRAYRASARFNPDARIRVSIRGDQIETSFVSDPEEDDEILQLGDLTIIVARDLGEGILDTSEEHDQLILKRASG